MEAWLLAEECPLGSHPKTAPALRDPNSSVANDMHVSTKDQLANGQVSQCESAGRCMIPVLCNATPVVLNYEQYVLQGNLVCTLLVHHVAEFWLEMLIDVHAQESNKCIT